MRGRAQPERGGAGAAKHDAAIISSISAQQAGFRWDPEHKWWVKQVRESKLDALAGELPFKVRQTEAA